MGIYRDHVLPRVVNATCGIAAMEPHRQRVCAGLHGQVLEVGFGSGLNVPSYPATVTRVRAVEPADLAWRLAADRIEGSAVPVERAGLDGQQLPFAAETFDSALVTWSLCTIPDPVAVLEELGRVLRPGGALHFLEHGLAPDAAVRTWQRRLEPIQRRIAGGCHLTREPVAMLELVGFTVVEAEHFYQEDAPKVLGATSLGVARL